MTLALDSKPRHIAEMHGAEEPFKEGKPGTLSEYVELLVGANPAGMFTEIGFDGSERSRRYCELFEEAKALATRIRPFRPGKDQFVLLCYQTVLECIPAAWACLLNGFSFMPLSLSALARGEDQFLRHFAQMGLTDSPLVLTEVRFKAIASKLHGARRVIVTPSELPAATRDASAQPGPVPGVADILIETSGTTGTPKIARLGGDTLVNRLFDGIGPDRRVSLNVLAHHSVGGLRLLLPLGSRTIYLHPARMLANPAAWLDCVTRFGVTDAGMSSAMAAKINECIAHDADGWNASTLQRLAFGSETIAPAIVRKLIANLQALGMEDASVFLVYSMTETGPLFSSRLPAKDVLAGDQEAAGRFRLNRCTDSWSVRILRENGDLAATGETGRIVARSRTRLFRGYEPDGQGVDENGWFDTGDLGLLDEHGLLIAGREKSTIIINARKICSEDVERCLSEIDGIKPGLAIAAPIRNDADSTDELAVFFTPQDSQDLTALGLKMQAAVAKGLGVKIGHLVPIDEAMISRTSTGKVDRKGLVAGLAAGRWSGIKPSPGQFHRAESLSRLSKIWKEVLQLAFEPGKDESFFDLGGDSLAAAQLLFAVEEAFHCRLPLERFLEHPTLARMAELISTSKTDEPLAPSHTHALRDAQHSILHKIESFMRSWHGERLFDGSLLLGFNTGGSRPPIFWILQTYVEALQLANNLGPDQPFYAMRSCAGVLSAQNYTKEILETVCDRYLWEMLSLPLPPAFVLGGNCQGGIIAAELAHRLQKIGRQPCRLVLLEWSFSTERYAGPATLIYCEESFTAGIYRDATPYDWRRDFPQNSVASIPGKHGEWSGRQDSVVRFAEILLEQTGPAQPLAQSEREKRATQSARRRAETRKLTAELAVHATSAKELQTKLVARNAELEQLRTALAMRDAEFEKLRAKLKSQSSYLQKLKASRSWRLTAPLRAVSTRLLRMGRSNLKP